MSYHFGGWVSRPQYGGDRRVGGIRFDADAWGRVHVGIYPEQAAQLGLPLWDPAIARRHPAAARRQGAPSSTYTAEGRTYRPVTSDERGVIEPSCPCEVRTCDYHRLPVIADDQGWIQNSDLRSTTWSADRPLYESGVFGASGGDAQIGPEEGDSDPISGGAAVKVRACIDCSVPTTNGTRCPACAKGRSGFAAGFRKAPRAATYDLAAWRRLSKRLRAEHVGMHGWVCPGWKREPHPSRDLTADHIRQLVDGGNPLDPANVRILCRACNSRAGLSSLAKRRARRTREARAA
jgi:HNH endonuclease